MRGNVFRAVVNTKYVSKQWVIKTQRLLVVFNSVMWYVMKEN